MIWNLPNKLTMARLALALVFFALLGVYDQQAAWGAPLMLTAFVLYIISGLTDIADGYIARRWNMQTAFGRIVDPFVDKVLVVGAFTMLAGSNFVDSAVNSSNGSLPGWMTGGMGSAVQAWMVVAILAREFAISGIRGYSESQGIQFPATSAGKIKMFVQSVAICTILMQMAYVRTAPWAIYLKVSLVWAATIVTVLSGLGYIKQARVLLGRNEKTDAAS